jgi:hypothetical protein
VLRGAKFTLGGSGLQLSKLEIPAGSADETFWRRVEPPVKLSHDKSAVYRTQGKQTTDGLASP